MLSEDFHDHEALRGIPPTRQGLETKYTLLREGFPDFRFTIEDLFTTGDRVGVRVTVRGTNNGAFMGRPPTGNSFEVNSVGIFRIAQQRIAEHWRLFDQFAMLAQLGEL